MSLNHGCVRYIPQGWGYKRGPVCLAVLTDIPKLRGSTDYTTTNLQTSSVLSPHHTEEGETRVEEWGEEEQVEEGREGVGYTRGPACLAVLTDLPKLRGLTDYTTTNLLTTPLISPY